MSLSPLWVGQEKIYPVDDAFLAVSEKAARFSGMDEFRKWQLWRMVIESAKLKTGDIIEVGCGAGGSGLVIASAARRAGINDAIYLVDTFSGLVKCDPQMDSHRNGEMAFTEPRRVGDVLESNGIGGVTIVSGVFPDAWTPQSGTRLRFAHIDVDVYHSMRDAFAWVWPHLVDGGIVVLDDYGVEDCPGVERFVREAMALPASTWFLHGAGQAIVLKRGGE